MKFTRSSYGVIVCLLLLTIASVVSMSGCNEKKHVTPPLIGPSAGSGPTGGGDTRRIELLASPSEKQEVLETEQATVRITALLKNSIGQPMPDGTTVYWSSTNGTLDSVSTTSSNGSTGVTFTFPTRYSGCSQVTARSGDASATIRVCVTRLAATPTPALTVTPVPTATPARTLIVGITDNTTIITGGAFPTDRATIRATAQTNGQPDVGIQVNFTFSGPVTYTTSAAITNANGQAEIIVIANNTGTVNQTATITATTADGRSGTVQVTVQPPPTPTPTPTPTPMPTPTP